MNSKDVVVVGGGTAGWISALYAKKINPENNVILIESEQLGILGAGEGSVPFFVNFFNFLEIPIENLIKECNATIKNGIKFSNWSSKSNYFFHPFASKSIFSNEYNFNIFSQFVEQDTVFCHYAASYFNHNSSEYSFIEKLCNQNSVPFIVNEYNQKDELAYWSIHFDANLLAKYLKKIGEQRGIIRKEGIVKDICQDYDGYINKLITDKEEIKTDFVFDCTGFRRLIIGNLLKTEWVSHHDSLPVNSAIPFFLPMDKEIPPYTEAIAMDYGWMWKIPLQHRYGCGYVFDKNQVSEDKAKQEIENFLGFEVESPKSFSFNAGYYKDIWVKNCMAIGLSAGFIEPLEATSIWQAQHSLMMFFSLPNPYSKDNDYTKKHVNQHYSRMTQEIVDFLYLHYVTDKNNTDFWKNFTKNNKMPETVERVLSIIKERPLYSSDFYGSDQRFSLASFYYILIGNNILKNEQIKKHSYIVDEGKIKNYLEILRNQKIGIPHFINHKKYLQLFILDNHEK